MIRVLGVLQNQWAHDPERAARLLSRMSRPEQRATGRDWLFGGCLTGRRLRAAFGDACMEWEWSNASPKIGGYAAASFPADLDHPSLLPLHRGRDAVRWAIHMGERVTGGTVFWLADAVDAGPIAAQDWCFIRPDDDAQALWHRELLPMGVRLIGRVLSDLSAGRMVAVEQDEALATWEPAWERAPLHRPELLMIGGGLPEGMRVERGRDALRG